MKSVRSLAALGLLCVAGGEIRTDSDLLPSKPDWTYESRWDHSQTGYAVASAGDTNQDGFEDLIVGAYGYSSSPDQDEEGRAILFLGGVGGFAPTPAWSIEGEQYFAHLGQAVAGGGDFNGDGYDDFAVGAPLYDPIGGSDFGGVRVFYGGSTGISGVPTNLEGFESLGYFGSALSVAGDVDRDGYDDLIVGAPFVGPFAEGAAYLYQGGPGGIGAVPAWVRNGAYGQKVGYSVGGGGDVNGDGIDDFMIGENGITELFFGRNGGLPLQDPDWTSGGWGPGGEHRAASAGDVNGDGYADLLVGNQEFQDGSFFGQAAIFHGGPGGPSETPDWSEPVK